MSDLKNRQKIRKPLWKAIINSRELYLLLLPGVAAITIFTYIPIGGLILAFKEYRFDVPNFIDMPWVGLMNFQDAFSNPDFLNSLVQTIIIAVVKTVASFPIPIIFAIMLSLLHMKRFSVSVQTVLIMPHFLSWIIMSGIFVALLSTNTGVWGALGKLMNFEPMIIYGQEDTLLPLLVLTEIFKETGFSMIFYLAAIAGIDPQLYEAADLDGASIWQKVRHITLPGISFAVMALLILQFGGLLDAGFDQVFNMTPTVLHSPGTKADILDIFVYRNGVLNGNFSLATAVGMFQSIINVILILTAQSVVKKYNGQTLF